MSITEATDRAWHILTNQLGVRLTLAHQVENKDPGFVARSGAHVVPDEPNAKLGCLAALLAKHSSCSDEAHDMIYDAAARVGHPVRHQPTRGANGAWFDRRGNVVQEPSK
jgi:hypothetical protein